MRLIRIALVLGLLAVSSQVPSTVFAQSQSGGFFKIEGVDDCILKYTQFDNTFDKITRVVYVDLTNADSYETWTDSQDEDWKNYVAISVRGTTHTFYNHTNEAWPDELLKHFLDCRED